MTKPMQKTPRAKRAAEYKQMRDKLGDHIAPDNAANLMVYLLKK